MFVCAGETDDAQPASRRPAAILFLGLQDRESVAPRGAAADRRGGGRDPRTLGPRNAVGEPSAGRLHSCRRPRELHSVGRRSAPDWARSLSQSARRTAGGRPCPALAPLPARQDAVKIEEAGPGGGGGHGKSGSILIGCPAVNLASVLNVGVGFSYGLLNRTHLN